MKHFSLLALLLSTCMFIGCKSQPKEWEAMIEPQDTIINNFDTIAYAKALELSLELGNSEAYAYPSKFDKFGNVILSSMCDEEECAFIRSDSVTTIQIKAFGEYYKEHKYPNSQYSDIYHFYPNGNIRSRGVLFNNDVLVGKYCQYSQLGKLTNIKNYDVGYTFTPDSVLTFVRQSMPEVKKPFFGVSKGIDSNYHPVWVVRWRTNDFRTRIITLNGQTGEVISDIAE